MNSVWWVAVVQVQAYVTGPFGKTGLYEICVEMHYLNAFECCKMHCKVSHWFVTHLQRLPWMRATLSNDEEWFSNVVQGIVNVSIFFFFLRDNRNDSERSTRDTKSLQQVLFTMHRKWSSLLRSRLGWSHNAPPNVPWEGAMGNDPNNGCEGDYKWSG